MLLCIEDKEPPQVLYCPSDIVMLAGRKRRVNVTWPQPRFKDNVEIPEGGIEASHTPGKYIIKVWKLHLQFKTFAELEATVRQLGAILISQCTFK